MSASKLRSPIWFALVVCLVVALGAQDLFRTLALVGARVVYGPEGFPPWYNAESPVILVSALVNRLVCYGVAGYVGAFLVRPPSRSAVLLFVGVGLVGTVFESLPWSSKIWVWLLWSILAPLGAYVGVALVKRQARRA